MSEFMVNWASIDKSTRSYDDVKHAIKTCQHKVESIRGSISSLSGMPGVSSVLENINVRLGNEIKNVDTLQTSLNIISTLYKLAEYNISGVMLPLNFGIGAGASGTAGNGGNTTGDGPFSIGDLWSLISSGGVVGQYVSGLGGLLSGDYGSAASGFLSMFADLVSNAYEANPLDIKKLLFGLDTSMVDNAMDAIQAGGSAIGTTWKEAIGQYAFKSNNTVGENIASGCRWAAAIVTNAIDNYQEFGTVQNGRFWAELGIETGVDVLMGAGSTALVAAGAAALGISAPAVAVGAIAAGVCWGANTLVESLTGQDIGEWVSDGVCWAGEKIADGVAWAGEKISDGVEWAGEKISEGVDWVGDKLSDIGNGISNGWNSFCAWVF